jgi:hypothetical protein
MSDWQGRDAIPEDEREFPDLEPIRGRRLSDADNRGLPGDAGMAGGRGRHSSGRDGTGEQDASPWGGQARQSGQQAPYDQRGQYGARQPSQDQYAQDQYTSQEQYGQEQYGRYGQQQYGGRQSGYADEQYSDQQSRGQQYADTRPGGQQQSGRAEQSGRTEQAGHAEQSGRTQQPRQEQSGQERSMQPQSMSRRDRADRAETWASASSWDGRDDGVTDDPMEAFSKRWARRGVDTPEDSRKRRRWWIIGGSAVAAVIIAAGVLVYLKVYRGGNTATVGFGSLITTFLPGEIPQVPNACSAVSQATLSQYLPGGQPATAAPPLNGGADSQCTWTLDSVPTYRVIEVDISAFSPSGLARGNGSATNAAIDAYANDLQVMENPSRNSGQPKGVITELPGLGNFAFGATQVYTVNGTITDKATVIVRYHNVIVTAVVNGTEHAVTSKGTYGPVSMSTLSAAAQQVASQAVAQLTH